MWDFPGAEPHAGFVLPEVNFPVLSPCSDPKPGSVLGGTQMKRGTGFEPKSIQPGVLRGVGTCGKLGRQGAKTLCRWRPKEPPNGGGETEYERISQMSQSQATFLLTLRSATQQRQHHLET